MRRAILYAAITAALACAGAAPASAQSSRQTGQSQGQYTPLLLDLLMRPLQLQQANPEAPLTLDQEMFIARTREIYPDFYKWLRRQPGMRKPIREMTEADFQRFRAAFAKWFDARGAFPYGSKQAIEGQEFAIFFWNLMQDGGGD